MQPPVTRRCGPKAQRVPVRALISRAMAAKRSMPHAAARADLQPAGSCASRSPWRRRKGPKPQIAGDARELPREVHRLAMLAEARAQRSRAAQREKRDACQVSVQLIERAERMHEGSGGAVPMPGTP